MFYLVAKAAEETDRIVTCSGLDCNICGLFKVVANLFNWLLYVSAAVAIFFVVVGGLIYIGARGRDNWMSQAKRTVFWAISGFAFILVAHLAIRVSFIVMGATNKGVFGDFNCNADGGSALLPTIKSEKTNSLAQEVKNNGSGGAILAEGTTASDLTNLQDNISDEDLLIYALERDNARKPIIALSKSSHWFDWDLIKNATAKSTGLLMIKEAKAASNDNISSSTPLLGQTSEEEYKKIAAQIVESLVKNNQKVVTIVTKISESNLITGISVGDLYNSITNFEDCSGSGGTWYRFSDSCAYSKGACGSSGASCSASSSSPMDGCSCPSGMCRSGSECVKQQ